MNKSNFSLFFKANMFFSILIASLFLQFNETYQFVDFVLTFFGIVSTIAVLYIVYYILLFPLSFVKELAIYVGATIFLLTNIALIVDFFIFNIYKFHINAMVIDILTSPDALDSIQLGAAPVIVFCSVLALLISFEIVLVKKLAKIQTTKKTALNKQLNKVILIPILLIILVEKVSYGFASLLNKSEILSSFNVIPLYQPLTFNRMAAKYFDYKPDVELENTLTLQGKLNYPINPLQIDTNTEKFNIIIIASDSASFSSITDEITPNIENFKKVSISLENHFSGGNATRFGIFSLIYGLNSTYWFSFLNNQQPPVLFDALKQLKYDINIISSTNTNWPEFRKTCYVAVQDTIKDEFPCQKPWERDLKATEYFIEKLNTYDGSKPLFTFLFLDAPHGYSYPPYLNKFGAVGENINYIKATKGSEEIENAYKRYKNALYFNDQLFGDVITQLKNKNLYDNSLIIFTSDHGQEFYEYGNFGHNSAFSKAQIHVPLLIKLPKKLEHLHVNPQKLTSHNDIVPTILSLLGVKNDTVEYSNGYNLFDDDAVRTFIFSANWNNNAIVTQDYAYLFSNLPNKMFKNEVRAISNYEKVKKIKANSKLILDTMSENKRFYK